MYTHTQHTHTQLATVRSHGLSHPSLTSPVSAAAEEDRAASHHHRPTSQRRVAHWRVVVEAPKRRIHIGDRRSLVLLVLLLMLQWGQVLDRAGVGAHRRGNHRRGGGHHRHHRRQPGTKVHRPAKIKHRPRPVTTTKKKNKKSGLYVRWRKVRVFAPRRGTLATNPWQPIPPRPLSPQHPHPLVQRVALTANAKGKKKTNTNMGGGALGLV